MNRVTIENVSMETKDGSAVRLRITRGGDDYMIHCSIAAPDANVDDKARLLSWRRSHFGTARRLTFDDLPNAKRALRDISTDLNNTIFGVST